jgi:hypothetical protein
LLTAAAIFIAIAVFSLVADPADQGALRTYKEYVLTATILPGVLAMLWVLAALQGLHDGDRGRLGRSGMRIAATGLLVLVVDSAVTLASGSTDTVGPLYPVGILASLIGIVLLAVEWYRAAVLPRWTGPALAVSWFLGGSPILGSGGSMLILAAAFIVIALGLRRQPPARVASPVQLDPSVTA